MNTKIETPTVATKPQAQEDDLQPITQERIELLTKQFEKDPDTTCYPDVFTRKIRTKKGAPDAVAARILGEIWYWLKMRSTATEDNLHKWYKGDEQRLFLAHLARKTGY